MTGYVDVEKYKPTRRCAKERVFHSDQKNSNRNEVEPLIQYFLIYHLIYCGNNDKNNESYRRDINVSDIYTEERDLKWGLLPGAMIWHCVERATGFPDDAESESPNSRSKSSCCIDSLSSDPM